MSGAERIARERARQIASEGYSPSYDRGQHRHGQLARAAISYALSSLNEAKTDRVSFMPVGWPWPRVNWKPKDRVRDLERAGALIAAELDRLTGEDPESHLPQGSAQVIIEGQLESSRATPADMAESIVGALRKAGFLQ